MPTNAHKHGGALACRMVAGAARARGEHEDPGNRDAGGTFDITDPGVISTRRTRGRAVFATNRRPGTNEGQHGNGFRGPSSGGGVAYRSLPTTWFGALPESEGGAWDAGAVRGCYGLSNGALGAPGWGKVNAGRATFADVLRDVAGYKGEGLFADAGNVEAAPTAGRERALEAALLGVLRDGAARRVELRGGVARRVG